MSDAVVLGAVVEAGAVGGVDEPDEGASFRAEGVVDASGAIGSEADAATVVGVGSTVSACPKEAYTPIMLASAMIANSSE